MKTTIKIAVIVMMGMSVGVNAQSKVIQLEGANDPNFVNKDGNVGIGTTSPKTKLDVNGVLQVGENNATKGGIIIAQKYGGDDYIGTLSSNYSSGALIMGYGAAGMPNQGASGQLVSTFDNWNGFRSAIRVASGTFEFVSSPTKLQTPVGQQINVKSRFLIDNKGYVGIGVSEPKRFVHASQENSSAQFRIERRGNNAGFTDFGADADGIHFWVGGYDGKKELTIRKNGYIGIGVSEPKRFVHASQENASAQFRIERRGNNAGFTDFGADADGIHFWVGGYDGGKEFTIKSNGNAALNGKFEAKEIKVTTSPTADFVFEEDYNLPTLKSIEKHIKEKKHLPEIASAKEMEENGVNVGDFQIQLLQKIEELTLYTIEQEKEIKKEKAENKKQHKEMEEQRSKIERLEFLVEKLLKDKN